MAASFHGEPNLGGNVWGDGGRSKSQQLLWQKFLSNSTFPDLCFPISPNKTSWWKSWWKCKDAVANYTARHLTKEGCQRDCRASSHLALPCHLLWISSREAGQCAGTAEDQFPHLTTHSLAFPWYICFPRGSLHSEKINYTLSWVLRFRNLAKVDFHLSWSLQTSHASLLPLSTCLKAQCRQQFRERHLQPSSSQSFILISATDCSITLAKNVFFCISVYRLQNKHYQQQSLKFSTWKKKTFSFGHSGLLYFPVDS